MKQEILRLQEQTRKIKQAREEIEREFEQWDKKPNIEDIFIQSLTDEQAEMFNQIIARIEDDYIKLIDENEQLRQALVKKCVEIEILKGEQK